MPFSKGAESVTIVSRREFVTLLGGAAVSWPLAARAQQPAVPVVGFLSAESPDLVAGRVRAFHQGLSEAGYSEGRNLAIVYRSAEGQSDRLPALAASLVRRRVAVIATSGGTAAALAAKAATTTIPIVFSDGTDLVKSDLVASLNQPCGNMTGVSRLSAERVPKRLELLHEVVPNAAVIAFLVNPINPNTESITRDARETAHSLGRQIQVLRASTECDIDAAFATLVQLRASALLIGTDTFFNSRSEQLAALRVRYAVPAIYQLREFAVAGGLMSYGASLTDAYRQVGIYTGRILKGERLANLPVVQATKVDLVINLKTAKRLGLTVPPLMLTRADEVIE